VSKAKQKAIVPLGEGVVARRVRIDPENVVLLAAVVNAYDHLAWVHGTGDGELLLVTPEDMARELDAVLESARSSVVFERLD
jgi:hypothetical protein